LYLKNITLKGFKSFAKKSQLVFERGICVVVGPNGSGKSNIADAISWVMGEQSAKSLRGSSMEDVIFRSKKEELAIAEVSLLFDNTDRFLPLEFNEVKFTRRVFQKGGSDYFINSSPCRLIDILDITSESGIGKGLYTVINQGQIDAIALLKPGERKIVIDEILGIAKHKIRREKSKSKLSKVVNDIGRVNDLMLEVKRTLDPLEIESKKAQAYFDVLNTLKSEELSLFISELTDFNLQWDKENAANERSLKKIEELKDRKSDVEKESEDFEKNQEEKRILFEKLKSVMENFNVYSNRLESISNIAISKRMIFNTFINMFKTEYSSINNAASAIIGQTSGFTGPVDSEGGSIILEKISYLDNMLSEFKVKLGKIQVKDDSLNQIKMELTLIIKEFGDIRQMLERDYKPGIFKGSPGGGEPFGKTHPGFNQARNNIKIRLENIMLLQQFCIKKASQTESICSVLESFKRAQDILRSAAYKNYNKVIDDINSYNSKSNEYLRRINDISFEKQSLENEIYKADFKKDQIKERVKNLTEEILDTYNISVDYIFKNYKPSEDYENSRRIVRKLKNEVKSYGSVNPNATIEYKRVKDRYDFLYTQKEDLDNSRKKLQELIKEINDRIEAIFISKFDDINNNFKSYFKSLFPLGNGEMQLVKENVNNEDDYGIELKVDIGNNKMIPLLLLSGGEKALVSIAFLFSIFATNSSPFYVFDEIDAALDEMNLNRYIWLVKKFAKGKQVIIITHQKKTMEIADTIYGITMQSSGMSKIVSEKVKKQDAEII
jgi:chromosome segregation ATPase